MEIASKALALQAPLSSGISAHQLFGASAHYSQCTTKTLLPNPQTRRAPSQGHKSNIPSRCTARAAAGKSKEPYVEPTFVFDFPTRETSRLGDRSGAEPSTSSPTGEAPKLSPRSPMRPSPAAAAAAVQLGSVKQPPPLLDPFSDAPLPSMSQPPTRSTPPPNYYDSLQVPPDHKSGYVALIGQPNAGKSTLLNAMIGQRLSIVTRKPQTTRHRILGLCSARNFQIMLYDTPGVMPKVLHKLDDCMMHSVRTASINADCLALIVDCTLPNQNLESLVDSGGTAIAALRRKPCVVVLNKRDKLKPGELAQKVKWYTEEADRCLKPQRHRGEEDPPPRIIPVSARQGRGIEALMQWILYHVPYGPAYYPKDVVSELPERFFVAEILREHLMLQYYEEVPYACQVVVSTFQERQQGKDYIALDILVEQESQKGILLGKGGLALKTLATSARIAIEEFLGRKAYLEIKVKVKENWREDEKLLKQYGLSSQARGDWY